jgi:hypothetical protein
MPSDPKDLPRLRHRTDSDEGHFKRLDARAVKWLHTIPDQLMSRDINAYHIGLLVILGVIGYFVIGRVFG